MKKILFLVAAMWGGAGLGLTNTNVVALGAITVAPEEYKNKLVVYSATYQAFYTSVPAYMVSSGFKEGKWFLLDVGSPRLPVLLKKNDANNNLLASLRAGSTIRVAGRVREFRVEARRGMAPDFYVEADSITLESGPPPMGGGRRQDPFPRGWMRERGRPADR